MKKGLLDHSFVYRHRVLLGFVVLTFIAVWMAGFRFWSFPGGLTDAEISAATISGHWSLSSMSSGAGWIVNLPWNILQWASISLFGLSAFSIRLPAVILMIVSAVSIFFLLKKWSRFSIAMVGTLLAVSSTLFISLSRNGDAAAMMIFLITSAITAATAIVIDNESKAKHLISAAIIGLCLALMFYLPGGVYISAVLITVGLLHPKVRYLIVRSKVYKIILAVFTLVILLLPLILGIITNWDNGGSQALSSLLLVDGSWSLSNLVTFLEAVFTTDAGFNSGIITPITTMAGLLIIIIGGIRTAIDIASARSYMILSMLLAAIVISLRRPDMIFLLFVPFTVLSAVGIEVLISKWYSLFPINPYAKVFAFAPLAVLVLVLSLTSIGQYVNAQNYSSQVVHSYNMEFNAARQVIADNKKKDVALVVNQDQIKFYDLLKRNNPNLHVTDKFDKNRGINIVLYSAGDESTGRIPTKIVTNWHSQDEALLKVYSK